MYFLNWKCLSFSSPKHLVAYARIDSSVFSSGEFVATQNKITKRGFKQLRRAVYLALTCGLRGELNPRLREYYDRKKSEGKSYQVAVVACPTSSSFTCTLCLRKGNPTLFNLLH
ncbi:transposase, partial [Paenibacillus sinensis]